MARVVGRLFVDSLEAHDIDLIYCVPGESYLGFTNAMADFQTAGTDLAMGTQSGLASSETPLTNGSKEFQSFAASVKATCG